MKNTAMKKHILIIAFIFGGITDAYSHGGDDAFLLIEQNVGYQWGYGFGNMAGGSEFDFKGTFVFLNYSYNYQNHVGHKAFVGVGLARMLQFQYGYAFNIHQHLYRIRLECPFQLFLMGRPDGEMLFLKQTSVGLYYENSISTDNGYVVGFSINVPLFGVAGYPMNFIKRIQNRMKNNEQE
jgi:hypothetical protein